MTMFDWNDDLSLGIKEIDDQHRQLIEIINEVYESICAKQDNKAVGSIIGRLFDYVNVHFSTEEKYMAQYNYPEMLQHKKEHEEFYAIVVSLKKEVTEGKTVLSLDVLKILREWFKTHLSGTDQRLGKFLKKKGFK